MKLGEKKEKSVRGPSYPDRVHYSPLYQVCFWSVWVNRPSLTCMLAKLCLSAVNDSCVFETFGLTKKMFLIKGNQRASQSIFHLEPARTTVHCVYNSSMSVTRVKRSPLQTYLHLTATNACIQPQMYVYSQSHDTKS